MRESQTFVITINRMLGSGGAYIGQQLAKKLNVLYLDREIVRQVAKELYLPEEEIAQYDEKTTSLWDLLFKKSTLTDSTFYMPPSLLFPNDRLLFDYESKVIERTSNEGSAIIIGRGSSHILRNHPRHISIFLHADDDFRKERVQKIYNLDEKAARKKIVESDKRRNSYYKTFTGNKFSDSKQYTMCLDVSKIGIDGCIEIILKYAEQKFGVTRISE